MNNSPLEKFSYYSKIQSDFLSRFSQEIFNDLEAAVGTDSSIDCTDFNNIWGRIWLWVLGSYEIVRSMDQYRSCFSERVHPIIKETKSTLANLRIPMAKQEKRGNKKGTVYEPSVASIDLENKDFGYEVNGGVLYFREIVRSYSGLIEELHDNDVLCSLDSIRESS